jgi:hypothetical protein
MTMRTSSRHRATRLIFFAWFIAGALFSQAAATWAQTAAPTEDPKLAAADKDGCIRNLKLIYEAIQAYRVDHKDLPNWLSDLVPQYISDANVLICPACKRTGQSETSALADPKIPSSYFFEFCPVPLDKSVPVDEHARTHRDWKRRQMGLVGSAVPLVRCRHHDTVLNLAFDGTVYESSVMWEELLTNRVNLADLAPAKIFASDPKPVASGKGGRPVTLTFPRRSPDTKQALLDLTPYYNAMLTESWHGGSKNDLASLPTGEQTLAGTQFDVRGIIQLASKSDSSKRFPPQVKGIKVHQKCEHLEFLHGVGFGTATDDGKRVGTYIVHFATNQMQLEIPIYYGRDVRNWHTLAEEKPASKELTVAWTGANAMSRSANNTIRLFKTTWTNVVPALEIESIDYVSAMGQPAPFLIAITAE